jgi:hypothetical protein
MHCDQEEDPVRIPLMPLTAENDWTERRNPRGPIAAGEYHLTIVISDFLSSQVIDRACNWSGYSAGRLILLLLDTKFDIALLNEKGVPKEVYADGFLPETGSDGDIKAFRLNPAEICTGIPPDTSSLPGIASEIVNALLSRTEDAKAATPVVKSVDSPELIPEPPVLTQTSIWAKLGKTNTTADVQEQEEIFM